MDKKPGTRRKAQGKMFFSCALRLLVPLHDSRSLRLAKGPLSLKSVFEIVSSLYKSIPYSGNGKDACRKVANVRTSSNEMSLYTNSDIDC